MEVNTKVEEKDLTAEQFDDLFALPGEEVGVELEKPSMFSRASVEVIPDPGSGADSDVDDVDDVDDVTKVVDASTPSADEIIQDPPSEEDLEVIDEASKSPAGMLNLIEEFVKEGKFSLYEDMTDEDLQKMSQEDVAQLFKDNIANLDGNAKAATKESFYKELPEELRIAAEFHKAGGRDFKGLFKELSVKEELKNLSIDTEQGQEQITRSYLQAKNFGTPEEIEAEIEDYKDMDRLAQKAAQFKPKLDVMSEDLAKNRVKQEQAINEQRLKRYNEYQDDVYNSLKDKKLGDLDIQDDTAEMLFNGLIKHEYPTSSGKNSNLLGHLLDKHQNGAEKRFDLLAEATWLLKDPEGYKAALMSKASNKSEEKTFRTLRQQQSTSNKGSSLATSDSNNVKINKQRPSGGGTLRKRPNNIFGK